MFGLSGPVKSGFYCMTLCVAAGYPQQWYVSPICSQWIHNSSVIPPPSGGHAGLSLSELCNPAGFMEKMWAMEGGMSSTRPNSLLSLTCLCRHTGSDLTLTAKSNQLNWFFKKSFSHSFSNWTRCVVFPVRAQSGLTSQVRGMKRKNKGSLLFSSD